MVCALHAREIIWVGLHSCISQRGQDNFLETVLGLLSAPLAFGGTAVSLFFVVSGYCIHRSFATKLAADPGHRPNWRSYFIRRAWRIYPVLISVILLTFLLDQYTLQRFPNDPKLGSLSLRTMLVNICALQGLAGPWYGSDGPLWTLSIEIQLYALYPVVFYLIQRRGLKTSLLATLVVSMACVAIGVLFPGFQTLTWFGPYWFCWTLGCVVAELQSSKLPATLKPGNFAVWCLVSACGFGLWLTPLEPLAFSCVGCFWALIILKCLRARVATPFLPLAWLAKLGVISYSLYAVHKPVCLFARSLFFHGTPSREILYVLPVMVGCVLAAAGLFFLVERHSLRVPGWLRGA
jgi:peptidoglycan/LPS O-acetylase OafA/YrhL